MLPSRDFIAKRDTAFPKAHASKGYGRFPVFDIIQVNFSAKVDMVVGSAGSMAEADRLVAELSAGRSPSTFFYWVTRRGGR